MPDLLQQLLRSMAQALRIFKPWRARISASWTHFLKNKDKDKILGNLYRITTKEGHVKWVCLNHYRSSYRETAMKSFLQVLELNQGEYDPQLRKVTIQLRSAIRARKFFTQLEWAPAVNETDITFLWDFSPSDLKSSYGGPIKNLLGAFSETQKLRELVIHNGWKKVVGNSNLTPFKNLVDLAVDMKTVSPQVLHCISGMSLKDISLDCFKEKWEIIHHTDFSSLRSLHLGNCSDEDLLPVWRSFPGSGHIDTLTLFPTQSPQRCYTTLSDQTPSFVDLSYNVAAQVFLGVVQVTI
ncbi:hypothetical protein BGZ92_005912 [Podila epicladia]|nr:hypothetical protein BGZ92_005912 [Podila epicladia]